jgi:hypothetical protein
MAILNAEMPLLSIARKMDEWGCAIALTKPPPRLGTIP